MARGTKACFRIRNISKPSKLVQTGGMSPCVYSMKKNSNSVENVANWGSHLPGWERTCCNVSLKENSAPPAAPK